MKSLTKWLDSGLLLMAFIMGVLGGMALRLFLETLVEVNHDIRLVWVSGIIFLICEISVIINLFCAYNLFEDKD